MSMFKKKIILVTVVRNFKLEQVLSKMKNILCGFTLFLTVHFIAGEEINQLCDNGVFKCVSSKSLRICFNGQLITSEFFCPNSTYCSEKSSTICVKELIPELDSNEIIDNNKSFRLCTEIGIFSVEDSGCTTYLNCSNGDGDILTDELTCDSVSLFDPESKSCSENFECPDVPQRIDFKAECTPPNAVHICTKEGYFPAPNTNCSEFIWCKKIYSGFKNIKKPCKPGTFFDPSKGKCTKEYVCEEMSCFETSPIDITTVEISTITNPTNTKTETTTLPNGDLPLCTINGRVAIPNTGCKSYRLCVSTSQGFVHQDFVCPSGYFNPETQRCSTSYICPDWPNATFSTPTENTTYIFTPTEENVTDAFTNATTSIDSATTTDKTGEISLSSTHELNSTDSFNLTTILTTTDKVITDDTPSNWTSDPTSSSNISTILTTTDKVITDDTPSNWTIDPTSSSNISTILTTTDKVITDDTPSNWTIYPTNSSNISTTPEIPSTTEKQISDTTANSTDKIISSTITDSSIGDSTTLSYTTHSNSSWTDDLTTNLRTVILDTTTEQIINTPVCTEQGRMSVPNTNCKMYVQCTLTTSGFLEVIYMCPEGFLFNPNTKKCSESFICIESEISSTTILPSTMMSTTTENTAPIVPKCTSQGKFPILNTKCKNYLSCILTTTGFKATEYACSQGLYFNPKLQRCTADYTCMEIQSNYSQTSEIINETIPLCVEKGKFLISNSGCKQYILCAQTATGFKSKTYTCPIDSLFDSANKRCSKNYNCTEMSSTSSQMDFDYTNPIFTTITSVSTIDIPTCQKKGKFLILNSGCKKYLLCAQTTTGFISKIYNCPHDSLFNSVTKRCSKAYICPESAPTSNTEIPKTTPTLVSSTTVATTTIVISECTEEGKFLVANSGCEKYILCVQSSVGFKSRVYKCPPNSLFNSEIKKCQRKYICPELIPTTIFVTDATISDVATTNSDCNDTIVIPECVENGKFPIKGINCTKYILCSKTLSGFRSKIYECPNDSKFDPNKNKCSISYKCTEILCIDETTTELMTTTVESYLLSSTICSTIGKFPDISDPECKYYYDCEEMLQNNIHGKLKKCEDGYRFDPEIQKCSITYFCNKILRLLEAAPSENIISPTFLVNGRCTTIGRYAVPGSLCKKYVYCSANPDGTLKATNFVCPTTTVFNQAIQKCTSAYICPDSICNFPGIISNPNIKDCTSYIECTVDYNPITGLIMGYIGKVEYCPAGMRFDPISLCCTNSYICPTQ